MVVPAGSKPWCCCHLRDWPSSANSLDGATTLTSPDKDWAIMWRRFSLFCPSLYAFELIRKTNSLLLKYQLRFSLVQGHFDKTHNC